MVSFDHIKYELLGQLKRAADRGQKDIVISAVELHVALGVFPNSRNAKVVDVMEAEKKPGDVVLVGKDDAAGLTIRYLLPR